MQVKRCRPALQSLVDHVYRVAGAIDGRRAHNADLVLDIGVGPYRRSDDRQRIYRSAEIHMPQGHCRSRRVCIESVQAVVHGGDDENVARACAGQVQRVYVERLRIDLTVHRISEELAELRGIHVIRIQQRFVQRGVRAIVIVIGREHVDLRELEQWLRVSAGDERADVDRGSRGCSVGRVDPVYHCGT